MKTSIDQLQTLVFLMVCLPLIDGFVFDFGYRNKVLLIQIREKQLYFSQDALESLQSCLCSFGECSVSLSDKFFLSKYLAGKTSALTGQKLQHPPDARTVFSCQFTSDSWMSFYPDSWDCRVVNSWEKNPNGCKGAKCEIGVGLLLPPSCPRQCVELKSASLSQTISTVVDKSNVVSRGGCSETTPASVATTSKKTWNPEITSTEGRTVTVTSDKDNRGNTRDTTATSVERISRNPLIPTVNTTEARTALVTSDEDSVPRDVTLLVLGVITVGALLVVMIVLVRRRKRYAIELKCSHLPPVENLYCNVEVGGTTSSTSGTLMSSSHPATLQPDARNDCSIYEEVGNIDLVHSKNLHTPHQSSELPTCSSYSQKSPTSVSFCTRGSDQSQVNLNLGKKSASCDLEVSQPSSSRIHCRVPSSSATCNTVPSLTVTSDSGQDDTACFDGTTARGNNRSAASSDVTLSQSYFRLYQDDENAYTQTTENNRSSTHTYEPLKMKPVQVSKKPKVALKSHDNSDENDVYQNMEN